MVRDAPRTARHARTAIYTYLATVYTTSGIRARPTRPTRPEGTPGLVPRPAQARLFVRPVGSTALGPERGELDADFC